MSKVVTGPDTEANGVSPAADTEPTLVMPAEWVIDELVRDRLARQLMRAPAHVQGVVAEAGALPSGASFRVHAERLCMRPFSVAAATTRHAVEGAALLRAGVGFEVGDDVVRVDGIRVLVDPGTHVHDPWRPVAPPQDASPIGRPPFPRRPVVVLLACEPDVEALDWARSLVNNLVRRDVEGRLAMLDVPEGLHLTQPCLPNQASIRALRPDVVVALDRAALERAPAWCDFSRSTVLVEYVPDVAFTTELVPWQLGRSRGRLRARIGRRADAPGLVSLVNRLCAGPHPAPPTDATTPRDAVAAARASPTSRTAAREGPAGERSVSVVSGEVADHDRLGGLVDHLVATGHRAELAPLSRLAASALREADILVLGSATADADLLEVIEVIEHRRQAGRPTVADIDATDLVIAGSARGATSHLGSAAERLASSSGSASTGNPAVLAALRRLGMRAHFLPTLVTRARAAELRSVRRRQFRLSDPVIGWTTSAAGAPHADYGSVVADALLDLLEARTELHVEAIGDTDRLPARFRTHPRVGELGSRPPGETIARWSVHVWSPPLVDDVIADDIHSFVDVSAVGVPTVMPAPARGAIGGHPPPGLLVDCFSRAADWTVPLRRLLDNEASWSRQSRAAVQRFDTMHGPAASAMTAHRFLGWALYRGGQV